MPANNTGWFFHSLARETGNIGQLFSPNGQRQTFPWLPYALDNGAFTCWDMRGNVFDQDKWNALENDWHRLLVWSQTQPFDPRWAIVPDVPGDTEATLRQWKEYASIVQSCKIPLAIAVQNGMTKNDVRDLSPEPDVVAVGGTTEWKWEHVEYWARCFKRVHVLRCNSPEKLHYLSALGIESCDGTGWYRGNPKQLRGLEEWARKHHATRSTEWLSDYTFKNTKKSEKNQITFA